MRFLIVADPVDKLKPAGDSTLVIAREMLERRHIVHWGVPADLELERPARVFITSRPVTDCESGQAPRLGTADRLPLDRFHGVLIRKDPPFGRQYLRLCWLLSLAESKTWVFNSPRALLRYHEKLLPLEAVAQGFLKPTDVIPTFIGSSPSVADALLGQPGGDFVSKPFFGYAGRSVKRWKREALFAGRPLPGQPGDLWQPFLPEVHVHGDRRVFFLNGKLLAHFVRIPKEGDFVSNLAQGGSAESRPLRPVERRVLERLGRFLKAAGIELAGADLIGTRVSEVNVTSPTGLRSLEQLEGKSYAREIVAYCEKRAR